MTKLDVISADSHIIEPPNLWIDYIDPAFRDRAPHCERENGKDVFKCEGGVSLIQVGAVSGAGKKSEDLVLDGTFEENAPPGSSDPHARLGEMDVDGVQAEVLYPSVALRMFGIEDAPYQLACFKAYNDWMADFCKPYPNRLKGIGVVPIENMEVTAGELRRCKEIGLSGVSISVNPIEDGRHYDDPMFDPMWAAAEETGLPVSLHILTERKVKPKVGLDRYVGQVLDFTAIETALTRMILSGVFSRFPGLRIVSAENDAGWAGYFLERLDYVFDRRKAFYDIEVDRSRLPSEFFRDHVYLTFMRDRSGILVRDMVGADNLMWSSDYPHLDSTWPNSQKMIERLVGDIPAEDRRKIIAENAAKLYNFN